MGKITQKEIIMAFLKKNIQKKIFIILK